MADRDAQREAIRLVAKGDLKQQQRELSLMLHPDKVQQEELKEAATQAFQVLQNACQDIKEAACK
jgi:DnaJ-class molecular chaperone